MRQANTQSGLLPSLAFRSDPLCAVARFALAAVFVYAGVIKLAAPVAFAATVSAYGLVPQGLLPFVAVGLPALEVVAGLGLVFNVRGSLAAILGMTLLFLAVLGYGIALGLDVDCGCYGPGDPEGEALHGLRSAFVRDLGLLALVAYVYWRRWIGRGSPTSEHRSTEQDGGK